MSVDWGDAAVAVAVGQGALMPTYDDLIELAAVMLLASANY
jgi:hypothetical protein